MSESEMWNESSGQNEVAARGYGSYATGGVTPDSALPTDSAVLHYFVCGDLIVLVEVCWASWQRYWLGWMFLCLMARQAGACREAT